MFKFSDFIIKNKIWGFFCAFWAIVLLAPFVPFPAPLAMLGFPWKPELTISVLLFLFLTFNLLRSENPLSLPGRKSLWVLAPMAAFILWSGLSVLWAESASSVLHHTLVWAIYLIFFLVFARIASDRKLLTLSLYSLGGAVGIFSLLCIIEFLFSAEIGETFGFRYGKYAELSAVVFPLFFSFVLRLKGKNLLLVATAAICVWLTILFALSRASFFTAILGLSVFLAFRLFSKTDFAEKKRLMFAAAAIVLITVFVQFSSLRNDGQNSVITRLSNPGDNAEISVSQNIRFLFYGVAKEIFADNLIFGIGADNFALKFDDYRAVFSTREENEKIARQDEIVLPERVHNEYLQILTELGIVGGIIFLLFAIGILKLSFANLRQNFFRRSNILDQAAFAGLCVFAISSLFSSFSFRLMQNGLIFFFLLAILLKDYFAKNPDKKITSLQLSPYLKTAFASIAVVLCLSLAVFSGLKAAGQYLVYRAETSKDFKDAEFLFKTAEQLDSSNVAPNYSFALRLMNEKLYKESAVEFQKAVDKGLYTSVAYSQLVTAHTLAGQLTDAEKTLARAVEIYPFSVFVRVRYAAVLEQLGKQPEAEKHFEIAKNLDNRQAETWRHLITGGALHTAEISKGDSQILPLMKLKPILALYAVIDERSVINPEEKLQLSFNK